MGSLAFQVCDYDISDDDDNGDNINDDESGDNINDDESCGNVNDDESVDCKDGDSLKFKLTLLSLF